MQWLAGLAFLIVAAQTAAGSGRITGVVTDVVGGVIPGATITVRSADSQRSTTTDSRGAFAFDDLPPGRYAAVPSLVGFYAKPRTDVIVSSGGTVFLKFELSTDCLQSVDYADMGLAQVLKKADVIAHIRISPPDVRDACAVSSHCTCTLHRAVVLRTLKGQPPHDVRLLQEGAGYASVERPYAPGDEFIAFLRSDENNFAFARIGGPHYMFRVTDGLVEFRRAEAPGLRNGMTVAAFQKALRAIR